MVMGSKSEVLDVGRANRLFTPAIRKAITQRDKGCTWPGCDRPPAWTDAHHVLHWLDGGISCYTNGCLLCGHHHTGHPPGSLADPLGRRRCPRVRATHLGGSGAETPTQQHTSRRRPPHPRARRDNRPMTSPRNTMVIKGSQLNRRASSAGRRTFSGGSADALDCRTNRPPPSRGRRLDVTVLARCSGFQLGNASVATGARFVLIERIPARAARAPTLTDPDRLAATPCARRASRAPGRSPAPAIR